MQFKGREKEIFRVLFCRDRKTFGRDRSFSFLHLLQQNLLQLLPLRIPQIILSDISLPHFVIPACPVYDS